MKMVELTLIEFYNNLCYKGQAKLVLKYLNTKFFSLDGFWFHGLNPNK